jgi:hypothetical protein
MDNELYKVMRATAISAGIRFLSDNKCCQLLAWLLHFGGEREAVIWDVKLNCDIQEAQNRLNIFGGETPNRELLPILQCYIAEADSYLSGGETEKPQWIKEIEETYNFKLKRK